MQTRQINFQTPYGAEIRLAVVEPFEAVGRRSVGAGKIEPGESFFSFPMTK